jgi:GrpB-like predicted nucleotidyltransferase (UPF0157 family)
MGVLEKMDEIIIVDYDPHWPLMFAAELQRIAHVLSPNLIDRIEHIGSTAVPGMPAKPIIDLLVIVHSLTDAKQVAIDPLIELGYTYWPDNPDADRMFFVRGLPPNSPRSHHIHIIESNSYKSEERILFRDYLRQYPATAADYAVLKRDLAQKFPLDREAYTNGKTEFVRSVLAQI